MTNIRYGLNSLPMGGARKRFMKRLSPIPLRKEVERPALKLLRKWLVQGGNLGAKKAQVARAPAMLDPLFGEEAELFLARNLEASGKRFPKKPNVWLSKRR